MMKLEELRKQGKYILIPIFESDERLLEEMSGNRSPWHMVLPPPHEKEVSAEDVIVLLHCGQPILSEQQYDRFLREGGKYPQYVEGEPTPFSACLMCKEPNDAFIAEFEKLGAEWNFCTWGGIILYTQIVFPDAEKRSIKGDLRSQANVTRDAAKGA